MARNSAPWQQFLRQHGDHWTAWWNQATGTPSAIFGEGLPLADWHGSSLEEARRHALATLHEHRELLGLGDDEFREIIGAEMGNAWTFTWEQFHQGLPVIGGRADVRVAKCGRIASIGSVAWPIPADFAVTPVIDEVQATALAWIASGRQPSDVPQAGPARTPRLVIWGDTQASAHAPVYLAWEIPISAIDRQGDGPAGRYYVDARTGKVLHYTNDKHECGFVSGAHTHAHADAPGQALPPVPTTITVMGFARDGTSTVTPPTNVPMAGLEVNVPGVGVVVTDSNGQFTVNIAAATQVTVVMDGSHFALIQGGSPVTQGATLTPGVNSTIQLLTAGSTVQEFAHTTCALWTHRVNEFCRSILGNSAELNAADAVLPTVNIAQTCNAYYTNNTINFFDAGGGCTNTSSSSVVAHEWGHGLDDRYGGISQVEGLSEGWGDIMSEYLLDSPIIGEGFFTATPTQGIRDGNNSTQYPPPGEVHAAGEVWMGFAWLYRQNLRTAFGTQAAIAISNQTVIGTLPANAQDQASAVLQVFIADDNDGNLANGVPHYNQLEPACLAHNLPYPVIQVGTVSVSTLLSTGQQLTPRMVTAQAVPISGSFSHVDLVYNDGTPHTRTMIPTGNANEYQALLPGQLAPATMTWHVEGVHSTGVVKRAPQTGEFTYDVRSEFRLYFEDFEHGAPGWTHGAVTGTDEWQIGPPQGRSGANWSDPSTAYSGSNIAGLDLNGNGAYENNSETWLRSPVINCTGYTGVRLRFRRWLTVDAGQSDNAQLRIGNITFWVNPTLQPLVENSWVIYDSVFPLASNNPSVVLEFRLRTDGQTTYGGWNIDDVEVYVTSVPVALPAELRILPEQTLQGTPVTATVHTQGALPFVLAIGSTGGPTNIPGLPPILVGGSTISLPAYTNASGNYTLPFTAPNNVPLTGLLWYSQVLTLGANSQFVTSNQFLNLFTR